MFFVILYCKVDISEKVFVLYSKIVLVFQFDESLPVLGIRSSFFHLGSPIFQHVCPNLSRSDQTALGPRDSTEQSIIVIQGKILYWITENVIDIKSKRKERPSDFC